MTDETCKSESLNLEPAEALPKADTLVRTTKRSRDKVREAIKLARKNAKSRENETSRLNGSSLSIHIFSEAGKASMKLKRKKF